MKRKKQFHNNRGSVALEASLTVPLFLLAMVYLFLVFQCVLAETLVYEAAAQTAEYVAEASYIGPCSQAVAYLKFPGYIDEEETVSRYIKGGIKGVSFLGSTMLDEESYVVLRVSYETKYVGKRTFTIRKRAYTGEMQKQQTDEKGGEDEKYVYVTDYQSVYHLTRNCTYLSLKIRPSTLSQAENQGYHACAFCGDACGHLVYVTEEGECYHSRLTCSGLKRTVYRKKKSEVEGLGACTRCSE